MYLLFWWQLFSVWKILVWHRCFFVMSLQSMVFLIFSVFREYLTYLSVPNRIFLVALVVLRASDGVPFPVQTMNVFLVEDPQIHFVLRWFTKLLLLLY